jgi:hypothetical protein
LVCGGVRRDPRWGREGGSGVQQSRSARAVRCDAIPVRWYSRAGAVGIFGTRKTFLETEDLLF